MRASSRGASWRPRTSLCPTWVMSEAALESETLTAPHISPTPPLVSGASQLHHKMNLKLSMGFLKYVILNDRNALEGFEKPDGELDESVTNLHNLVHSFLNGTSALAHSAANDPIFVVGHWLPAYGLVHNITLEAVLSSETTLFYRCFSCRCSTPSLMPFLMSGWDGFLRPTPLFQTKWLPLVTTGTTTWSPSSRQSPTRRFM